MSRVCVRHGHNAAHHVRKLNTAAHVAAIRLASHVAAINGTGHVAAIGCTSRVSVLSRTVCIDTSFDCARDNGSIFGILGRRERHALFVMQHILLSRAKVLHSSNGGDE
jgi:hypothetical protein